MKRNISITLIMASITVFPILLVIKFFVPADRSTQEGVVIAAPVENDPVIPQENSDFTKFKFENGDIIFRRGVSLESRAITALDGDNGFSHAGIIRIRNSKTEVIHASFGEEGQTEEIIICEPIEKFLKPSSSSFASVYRFDKEDKSVPEIALAEAESFLEKKIPFDRDYNLNNAAKIYCTELIWLAYKKAGIDLTNGKLDEIPYVYNSPDKKFILPSSLLNSLQLKKIWTSQ